MHKNVFYRHFIRFIFYQTNIGLQNRAKKVKNPFSWGSRELLKDLILLKGQVALIEQYIARSKWLKIAMHKDQNLQLNGFFTVLGPKSS